jgi:hypothetical protein
VQQTRVTVNKASVRCLSFTFRTWTIRDETVESEQSTQLDKLDSAHYHAHVVFCAKKLGRFHARVSATEQTTSGIQQQGALGTLPSIPFAKHRTARIVNS